MIEMEPQGGARIKVMGVGGGGTNAVNHMVVSGLEGVEFMAVNTDKQALKRSLAQLQIQIGDKLTKGLGAGANPELGRQAAMEDSDKLVGVLDGGDLVFITAGMGGGTGTGAAPVIAELAKKLGLLTIGVITKPFFWEGPPRQRAALEGIKQLIDKLDAYIIVPNQNLIKMMDADTTRLQAFAQVNEVLRQAVQGIADIINVTGQVNVDFADVRTTLQDKGKALMGMGVATNEDKAVKAVEAAINNPLLDEVKLEGAKSVLVNITAGVNLTLHELNEAMSVVYESVDESAQIIYGDVVDDNLRDGVRVTVIASGYEEERKRREESATTIDFSEVLQAVSEPRSESAAEIEAPSKIDVNDLNIPTFIRRGNERLRAEDER